MNYQLALVKTNYGDYYYLYDQNKNIYSKSIIVKGIDEKYVFVDSYTVDVNTHTRNIEILGYTNIFSEEQKLFIDFQPIGLNIRLNTEPIGFFYYPKQWYTITGYNQYTRSISAMFNSVSDFISKQEA